MATKTDRPQRGEQPKREPGSLNRSGKIPRSDPAPVWKELDVPDKLRSVVKLQGGILVASCAEVKGATRYDWQLRRAPGHSFSDEHSTPETKTEFSGYPLGPPGVPQCRVRAVATDGISQWSAWVGSTHDPGVDLL